ncbi:response regulator [Microbacterium sp. Mu-80]|uniref:Response regulator n=1 Tax=Microbacterium bandirmense TaxID=3122050 RepID=A0ABU8LF51_9MICO
MLDETQPKTAVIVEDDPDVRHLLSDVLESAGFSTICVGNGIDGVRAVLTYQPLITTLDVNLPGIDGFEAARRIRAQSDTHIIMLTALDEEADVVLGLGSGADVYLNKPFRPRELRARIEALLRRSRTSGSSVPQQEQVGPSFPQARAAQHPTAPHSSAPHPHVFQQQPMQTTFPPPPADWQPAAQNPPTAQNPPAAQHPPAAQPAPPATSTAIDERDWISHRDLRLNPEERLVSVRGQEVDLTRTEFDLLCALMESKRRVRSKADLTLVLRGESYVTSYFVGEADKRAIEAHMTNLRRKLGDSVSQPSYIETVRGVGYRLTAEVS